MKYFLRTAYGYSHSFANSRVEVKYQGMCQGNGAAPAGWAVISITILRAHKSKGHGATFVCPITHIKATLAAVLYVDDCDLVHIDMEVDECALVTHERMQESVTNWGNLLIGSGGLYKPTKCFYYLMSFMGLIGLGSGIMRRTRIKKNTRRRFRCQMEVPAGLIISQWGHLERHWVCGRLRMAIRMGRWWRCKIKHKSG